MAEMSKKKITGIKHADGRKIMLGGVTVKKGSSCGGQPLLSFGRVVAFGTNASGIWCEVHYYKEDQLPLGARWDDYNRGLLSCVDGGITQSIWISSFADTGEPAIQFRDGAIYKHRFVVGRWASAGAILESSLRGGPTGGGRPEDGWQLCTDPLRGPATRQRRADIRALCRSLVLWRLRCVPRPLSPSSPAEIEDEAWNAETDRLHDEFLEARRSISEPVQELLAVAQGSPKLRGIARDELNKLGEVQPYVLHELRKDDGGLKVLV